MFSPWIWVPVIVIGAIYVRLVWRFDDQMQISMYHGEGSVRD